MFRHVPACSGMFRVPGFIDGHFDTEMSNKCLVLIISVAFVGVTLYTLLIASPRNSFREESTRDPTRGNDRLPSMDLSKAFKPERVQCDLTLDKFQLPSLDLLIHALASKENPGISSISGLALYFNLNNACQPLGDVTMQSKRSSLQICSCHPCRRDCVSFATSGIECTEHWICRFGTFFRY